jgi:hypothetical protein
MKQQNRGASLDILFRSIVSVLLFLAIVLMSVLIGKYYAQKLKDPQLARIRQIQQQWKMPNRSNYQNDKYGFKFSIPQDWAARYYGDDGATFTPKDALPVEPNQNGKIMVYVNDQLKMETSDQEELRNRLKESNNCFDGFTFIKTLESTHQINGFSTKWKMKSECPSSASDTTVSYIFLPRNNIVVVVSLSDPSATPQYEQILQSFEYQ